MKYLFLMFLGGMIAVVAGAQYRLLEWAWQDYADFDRGMWQGLLLMFTVTQGHELAQRIVNRRERRA